MNPDQGLTGGARLGGANATWPFANLVARPGELVLKVVFFGTYVFPSDRVYRVQKYTLLPFVGWGVKIEHDIPEYPRKIIFWYLSNPQRVLDYISASGFTEGLTDTSNPSH